MLNKILDDSEVLIDILNKSAIVRRYKNGNTFYIEPAFKQTFEEFENLFPRFIDKVIKGMLDAINKNPVTLFCLSDENHYVIRDDAIIVTFEDICNKFDFDYLNKSRGSDYGD